MQWSVATAPPTHFATIKPLAGATDAEFSKAASKFLRHLRKRTGGGLEYLLVNEWSARGVRHAHVLLRAVDGLPRRVVREAVSVAGVHASVEPVRNVVGAVRYVFKDGRNLKPKATVTPASFRGKVFVASRGFLVKSRRKIWSEIQAARNVRNIMTTDEQVESDATAPRTRFRTLSGLVRSSPDTIKELRLDTLIPATVNDKVYKPVSPSDPATLSLTDNIRKQGLLEPIVITLDNVILSGHRRRVACKLAGLTHVKVRRHPIRSTDAGFLDLLVSFNDQRVKTVDETIRECVVTADKTSAHANLLAHRKAQADRVHGRAEDAGLQLVATKAARKRALVSSAKQPMLDAAVRVLDDNRDYWPLTLRQVHYRLLNNPPLRNADKPNSRYANNEKCYKDLSDLLSRARIAGAVPWQAIHDPTRPQDSWEMWTSPGPYLREQLDGFLRNYRRNLLQSQPAYFEVIGEKMTVGTVIERATSNFYMPSTIGRGYSSVDARYQLARRFKRSGKEQMVLLFLGDFDPEGENIPESFASSMRDEFGVKNITAVKVTLTSEQVRNLNLLPVMTAKKTSSRAAGFVAEHGNAVYELEAIEPAGLERILCNAIESMLDMNLFRGEQAREVEDAAVLDEYRQRAAVALGGVVRTTPD